jgi:hypothetical protein
MTVLNIVSTKHDCDSLPLVAIRLIAYFLFCMLGCNERATAQIFWRIITLPFVLSFITLLKIAK